MTGLAGHLRTVFTNRVPRYHALHERGSIYSPSHPDVVGCLQRWGNRGVERQSDLPMAPALAAPTSASTQGLPVLGSLCQDP